VALAVLIDGYRSPSAHRGTTLGAGKRMGEPVTWEDGFA
jgi:hypothetical protein